MSLRQTRWLLRGLIVLLWTAAAAAIVGSLVRDESAREPLVVATAEPATLVDGSTPEVADLSAVWSRPLRGPLVDPPPPKPRPKPVAPVVVAPKPPPAPKPKPPPPPPPKPDVTLVGTIIEADRPLAILSDATGRIDMKGPGQEFALEPPGVRLKSVDDASAVVTYRDHDTRLKLAGAAAKPKETRGARPRPSRSQPTAPADILKMRRRMRESTNSSSR